MSNIDENIYTDIYIYICIQTQEVQLISSQSCSKKEDFCWETCLTFQCLSSGCDVGAICNLTGMFGQFFVFFQDNCEGSNLKKGRDTVTLRNGIRVTVRCPSLTDPDDVECLQLLDNKKTL